MIERVKAMKYPIHKDFRKLRFLHMSKNIGLLRIENFIIGILYHLTRIPKAVKRTRIFASTKDGGRIKLDLFAKVGQEGIRPCLIYYPGGGFMMNASHIHKKILANIVKETGFKAVMVHYRLAPAHAFPTAFFDALEAMEYVYGHARDLKVDADHIGLAGDSSGGNLACAVALYNQDVIHQPLKALMLVYPGLGKGLDSFSRKAYYDTPMFNSSIFPVIDQVYYPNGTGDLERYAYPLLHPNPTGIGPVYIETAEFDCLHDDGIAFYESLKACAVACELNETKGTVHGYDVMQNSDIVKASIRQRIDFLKNNL
jgi:acetyl esterase